MSQRTLGILILLFIGLNLRGQAYEHYLEFAEEARAEGDLYGCKAYLEKAFALDSSELQLQYELGRALEATHYYQEALRLYHKVYSKGRGRFYPDSPDRIAQMHNYLGQYDEAIKYWKRARKHATEDTAAQARIEQRLKACSYALSHVLEDNTVLVKNAGPNINSTESEYAAEWNASDVMLFSSLRGDYHADGSLKANQDYHSRIYTSQETDTGLSAAALYEPLLNSGSRHMGNPSADPTGEYVYYSEINEAGNSCIKRKALHEPQAEGELIGRGVNLVGTNNSQAHVYLAADGEVYLLFSSDRAGGHGGYDLWQSRISGSGTAEAQNLGPKVNSPGNEVSPFIDTASALLYFSSDWHLGYGGYDVFSAGIEEHSYKRPVNLGLPINSPVNDLYYRSQAQHRSLTSNRSGSYSDHAEHCCNDIYLIEGKADTPVDLVIYDSLPSSIASVDQLRGLLPISLYFHNDIPDPGSVKSSTSVNYAATVAEYLALGQTYRERYSSGLLAGKKDSAEMAMQRFFEQQVEGEYKELEGVSRLILAELEAGKRIAIAIKGYASPLAQSDYNQKLTQRRIASIINYLEALDEGQLKPYMIGTDPALRITAIPFGEEASEAMVSDNPQDVKSSIYSLAAARERRVEILRIEELD